jgi:hypothetical protein
MTIPGVRRSSGWAIFGYEAKADRPFRRDYLLNKRNSPRWLPRLTLWEGLPDAAELNRKETCHERPFRESR